MGSRVWGVHCGRIHGRPTNGPFLDRRFSKDLEEFNLTEVLRMGPRQSLFLRAANTPICSSLLKGTHSDCREMSARFVAYAFLFHLCGLQHLHQFTTCAFVVGLDAIEVLRIRRFQLCQESIALVELGPRFPALLLVVGTSRVANLLAKCFELLGRTADVLRHRLLPETLGVCRLSTSEHCGWQREGKKEPKSNGFPMGTNGRDAQFHTPSESKGVNWFPRWD